MTSPDEPPTEAEVDQAVVRAREWIEQLESDASWARTAKIRDEALEQAALLRCLLRAAGSGA